MLQRFVDAAAVAAEIERVRFLSGAALRRRWQAEFGRPLPGSLPVDSLPGFTVVPNRSMRAAHSRAASVLRGAFSRRQMVDCEASAPPLCGQRPTASFIKGS